ncbi:MAG: methyl-accepting chemotaxis protein [Thermodesulfobacteriota bacterium]
MFFRGLKVKILALTVIIIILGFSSMIFLVIQEEEVNLINERRRASKLMAEPILNTIYKDMLEERADMPRFLIEGLKTIKDTERVQIIRSNGVEEAFQDFKTLKAVEKEFGEIKPEWLADHPDETSNVAEGIWHPEFKKALSHFVEGEKEPIDYIEEIEGTSLFTYLVPIEFRQKCSGCHAAEEEARGILMISTSLDDMYSSLESSRNKWLLYGIATIIVVALALGFLITSIITRPVERTVTMLKEIAEGKGDLTRRLEVSSKDEVGMLAFWFNNFVTGLQSMFSDIFSISTEVTGASTKIESSSHGILTSVQKQLRAAEEVASSIEEMDASIKSMAEDSNALNTSSKKVSASAQTVCASVDDVKFNNENLFAAAANTASAAHEMDFSINEVIDHVEGLLEKTGEVLNFIMLVGNKIVEIEGHSINQTELAGKIRDESEDLGMDSISKLKDNVEIVYEEVTDAADLINGLGQRSKEIGSALNVINDFAETTHLLALNASIIAAQAGEHGKGFAVVARQVKDLATKTSASTDEMAEILAFIQDDTKSAVSKMNQSSKRVAENLKLSRKTQTFLSSLRENAGLSIEIAESIKDCTTAQAKELENATDSMNSSNSTMDDIKSAAQTQTSTAKKILKDTVQTREFLKKLKESTAGLSGESRLVSDSTTKVADKIMRVAEATSSQKMLSARIVVSMETVKKVAEDNATLAFGLDKTVKEMNKLAESLRNSVGNFKT